MKEVAISEFKAKCFSLLDQVQKTKKPILVTRFGKPVAEVYPYRKGRSGRLVWLDEGRNQILGDIISPANDEDEWEVLRDETAPRYAHLDMEYAGLGSARKKNRAGNQKSRE